MTACTMRPRPATCCTPCTLRPPSLGVKSLHRRDTSLSWIVSSTWMWRRTLWQMLGVSIPKGRRMTRRRSSQDSTCPCSSPGLNRTSLEEKRIMMSLKKRLG
ncbi:hypothetical protein JZ751_028431, partial [Albula glossodonta]